VNTGTANRSLTTTDLNVPDSDTTGSCGLHAAVPVSLTTIETKVMPLSCDGGAPLYDAALISHSLSDGPTSGSITSTNDVALASPMSVAASAGAIDHAEMEALLAVATSKQAHEGLAEPFADDVDLWL
jgi:hypothetical protein